MNIFRTKHLPPVVARVLRVFYRVTRLYAFLRILCTAGIIYLGLALVGMHLDRVLFLSPTERLAITWIVHGTVVAYLIGALLVFLLRAPSLRQIAYELGSRVPEGDAERFATMDSVMSESFADHDPVRTELLAHLQHETEDLSSRIRPFRMVRDMLLPRLVLGLLAAVLVCTILATLPDYQFPLMVRRFLSPRENLPKPSFINIRVTPEQLVLGRGEEAVIQAEIEGEIPVMLDWIYRIAGVSKSRCIMATAPGRTSDVRVNSETVRELNRIQRRLFVFSQSELSNGFSYLLRCADAETAVHFVEVIAQPRITELRLIAKPPAYTRQPVMEIVNPRQPVTLFPDTEVELQFTVDQDVTEWHLLLNGSKGPTHKWNPTTHTGSYTFTMKDKLDIEVRVQNDRGFINAERARISLIRLDDRPPQLQLEYPTGDLTVVPGELIPVQALAEDDLEITSAGFRFLLNPESNPDASYQKLPIVIPEPYGDRVALTENFDLGQTTAEPGDELLLFVRVRDSAGNDAESRPIRLRINAFTRGENERRRLLALQVVNELFANLAEQTPEAADPALDRTVYEKALKTAADLGVPLDSSPSIDSICRLLENEHHFTDVPRHKDDVRKLQAVMLASWAMGKLPDNAVQTETTNSWPKTLASEIIEPVMLSRRLQNLTWRLFGMQYEIANMRNLLTDSKTERQIAAERLALETLILDLIQYAEDQKGVQTALQAEQALQNQIEEIKTRAEAESKTEGEQVNNMFGSVELDVEVNQLNPEDLEKIAEIKKQLKVAETERVRLSEAALLEGITAEASTVKMTGLEPKELEMFAIAAFDPMLKANTDVADVAIHAENRRARVQNMIDKKINSMDEENPELNSQMRRAELYMKALEDIGVDLASVAEATSTLDDPALKILQGDLNTAGYYLTRGNSTRKRAACDKVMQILDRMLKITSPAMPVLLQEEQQARERLGLFYLDAWNRVAEGLPVSAGAVPRPDLARQWAEADMRMVEFNPFASLTPRLRDMALLESLDAGLTTNTTTELVTFLAPTGPQDMVNAIASEKRARQLLALNWELIDLLGSSRISDREKILSARLLELTAARLGAIPGVDIAALDKNLLALPPTSADAATADEQGELIRTSLTEVNAADAENVLLKAARKHLPLGEPLVVASQALERAAEAVKAVEALKTSMDTGNTDVAGPIGRAVAAINRAVARYEQLVRITSLDAAWFDPLGATTPHEERLFLRVRETVGRYRGRTGMAVQNLTSAGSRPLDAAQLGSLGGDLAIIKAGVQAMHNTLKTAIDEYENEDVGPKYPIQEVFADTTVWVKTGRELVSSTQPAEVTERFVKKFAAARLEYLASRSVMLETATRQLQETVGMTEAGTADPEKVNASLKALRQGFVTLQEALQKAGKDPIQDPLRQDVEALLGRVGKFDEVRGDDDTAQRRQLLKLTELLKDTQHLLRRMRAEIDTVTEPRLQYEGGPDGIWLPETRLDAEVARQRLLEQLRIAHRQFTLGVLENLDKPVTPATCRELQAWSLFEHQVARSPLSGTVTPPRTEAGGDSMRDPLEKWLLDQLQEAADETRAEDSLRTYPAITRELNQSLKDYLRY